MYSNDSRYANAVNETTASVASSHDDVTNFAKQRLSDRCLKKFLNEDPMLSEAAISGFLANNQLAKNVIVNLSEEEIGNAREYLYNTLAIYTYRISDNPTPGVLLDTGVLYNSWRMGPGASKDVKGSHFVEKIVQDMTCTSRAEPFVRLMRKLTPRLRLYDESNKSSGVTVTTGSRLLTVPKNQETHRVIATEPSGNMCLQLAVNDYLTGALKSIGLDLETQWEQNKLLAQKGSLDDSLATIDLKSASDLITPQLIKTLWPAEWYYLLDLLRSEDIELPNGSHRKLYMMSTMGNGFTFPVMTLTLTALLYADICKYASQRERRLFINWKENAVFGDDIIIPSKRYMDFCDLLERAGLIVNYDKSFSQGPFRESCGGDYYKGVEVTPFYVKSLSSDSEVYVAINQAIRWQVRHCVYNLSLLAFLVSLLKHGPYLVPQWESDDSGIRCGDVTGRYVKLKPRSKFRKELIDPDLALLSILGGYASKCVEDVTKTVTFLTFLPRSHVVKYRRKNCRIPKGYANGADHTYMCQHETRRASILIEMMLNS